MVLPLVEPFEAVDWAVVPMHIYWKELSVVISTL
jgi:hypothetical protein